MGESAQLSDFAALRRLKELADSNNEQAMIVYADLACGRLSYIDFSENDLERVLGSVYKLQTMFVFCPLNNDCNAASFPPPEHFYETNVRTFDAHHVALDYYGRALRQFPDGEYAGFALEGEGWLYKKGLAVDTNPQMAFQNFLKSAALLCSRGMVSAALRYLDGVGPGERNEENAIQLLLGAEEQGNLAALALLAMYRKTGASQFVDADLPRAIREFEYLVAHRMPLAYLELAEAYTKGTCVEPNSDTAFTLYEHAAGMGNVKAKYQLAQQVMKRYGASRPLEPHNRAITLLQEAAAAQFLPAIFTLGAYYELGLGVEKNMDRARAYHEEAARLGFPQSMVEAGIFFEQGKEVAVDYSASFNYYMAAHEAGFAKGHFALGTAYMYGRGTEKNFSEAARLYELAAEHRVKNALTNLGALYEQGGFGLEKDETKAHHYFMLAADQGEVRGLAAKGRALLYGIQIPKDEVAAVDLLTKCAKQGDPLGCHLLSVCHEKGLGNLPKDEKAALDLCKRALSMGRTECEACVRRLGATAQSRTSISACTVM